MSRFIGSFTHRHQIDVINGLTIPFMQFSDDKNAHFEIYNLQNECDRVYQ
jgi:hypothetical protein